MKVFNRASNWFVSFGVDCARDQEYTFSEFTKILPLRFATDFRPNRKVPDRAEFEPLPSI